MQTKECCTPQKNRINYQKELEKLLASLEAVSYTHLTLPTIRLV